MDLIFSTIQDGIFAAIASIGFGSISNAPWKTLKHCGWIAAVGHATRFLLMSLGLHIIFAVFAGAILIGYFSRTVSQRTGILFESIAFVSLLPMIPGMYAYRTMQSFISFIQSAGCAENAASIQMMSYNALMTLAIILMMAIGVMLVPKKCSL